MTEIVNNIDINGWYLFPILLIYFSAKKNKLFNKNSSKKKVGF